MAKPFLLTRGAASEASRALARAAAKSGVTLGMKKPPIIPVGINGGLCLRLGNMIQVFNLEA